MLTEAEVEQATIEWFRELGDAYAVGVDLVSSSATPERSTYGDVVLAGRLRSALARINPHTDDATLEDVAPRQAVASAAGSSGAMHFGSAAL